MKSLMLPYHFYRSATCIRIRTLKTQTKKPPSLAKEATTGNSSSYDIAHSKIAKITDVGVFPASIAMLILGDDNDTAWSVISFFDIKCTHRNKT